MARTKDPTRQPVSKTFSLDARIVAEVELRLFSSAEQRVPYGAWSKFLTRIITQQLSLAGRREALAAEYKQLTTDSDRLALLRTELARHGYDI